MIDWLPAGDKAAAYYGVENGIFEEAGLDVSIAVGRGSSDVVTKLATGTADVGSGGLAALLQAVATEDVPVKAVLSVYTIQPDSIFTTEDSGIDSIADLVDKNLATATFSSSNVVWPLLLEANKMGAQTLGGLWMLVYQGATSFELWTGNEAPIGVMFDAAEKALAAA